MSKSISKVTEPRFDPFFVIILVVILIVPVLILPYVLDNPFHTPKSFVMILGALLMTGIYIVQVLRGKEIVISKTSTSGIILLLFCLNLISFIYTKNYFFTIVAAILNITCLVFFYFISLHTDGKRAFIFFIALTVSGVLVSIDVWFQYFDHYIFLTWAKAGEMIMGTIGNSNYLGAYLIFPLYAVIGLLFVVKGKLRLIVALLALFIMIAFLFSRARASWMGFFLSLPLYFFILKGIHQVSLRDRIRSHKRKVISVTIVSVGIFVTLWFLAPQRFYNMMDFKNVTESETLRLRITKYFRPSVWLFTRNPLFGTGLWSYRNMVYLAQAEINKADPGFFDDYPEPKPRRAHNEYIEILNDGGLVAATVLLIFLITMMRHGWGVIKNEAVHHDERTIAATAFSSIVAILIAATLFFPFRVNSTMLMTVLMLGILEGLYLKNQGVVSRWKGAKSGIGSVFIPIVCLLLLAMGWYGGYKPFKGEWEHFQYKKALKRKDIKAAENHILKAIEYSPLNSMYHTITSQFYNKTKDFTKASDHVEQAIVDFDGDLTLWSIWYLKGVIEYQKGSLLGAQAAFEKALYYYPLFEPARVNLKEVNAMIEKMKRGS
jgi:O-antigen ligase